MADFSRISRSNLLWYLNDLQTHGRHALPVGTFPLNNKEKATFYDYVQKTEYEVIRLEWETLNTKSKKRISTFVRCRLSPSICHEIWTCRAEFDVLAHKMVTGEHVYNDATAYGIKMEGAAISSFKFQSKLTVLSCGLIVCKKYPFLCLRPDGVCVSKDGREISLLEVKCPVSRKGEKITDGVSSSYVNYVYHDGTAWQLRKDHSYYTQVQLSLFITNLHKCNYFIYSSCDWLRFTVSIDHDYLGMLIPALQVFYFKYMLPKFVAQKRN